MDWEEMQQDVLDIGLSTFGKELVYTPIGFAPLSITAIFETSYQSIDPNTGVAVITVRPRLTLDPSDLPRPPSEGDLLETSQGDYTVTEYHPEGAGGGICYLQES